MDDAEGTAIGFNSENCARPVRSLSACGSIQVTVGSDDETGLRTGAIGNLEFVNGSEGVTFRPNFKYCTDTARTTRGRRSVEKPVGSEDYARLGKATVAAVAIERVHDIKRTIIFLDSINCS